MSKARDDGLFKMGSQNPFNQNFTGNSYLNQLSNGNITVDNVTFEPGCRNRWHVHNDPNGSGQVLLCTGGRGWYQEWGKPAQSLSPGDVVRVAPGVKHWHGAAKDSWFSHVVVQPPDNVSKSDWLEPVGDEHYNSLK